MRLKDQVVVVTGVSHPGQGGYGLAALCARAVWPIMKGQGGGKILNFSRAGGAQSFKPMMLAYNCAKAGIDALTTTLAREGKAFGIIVPRVAQPVSSLRNPWDEPELRARWPSKRYSKTWPVSVLWHFP